MTVQANRLFLDKMPGFLRRKPESVFALVAGFVIFSMVLVFCVDVLNIFDIRTRLLAGEDVPFLWYHWFEVPFENPVQWFVLALAGCAFSANTLKTRSSGDKTGFRFWLLMTIGVGLMLMEDVGDIRHELRVRVENLAGEENYGVFATMSELGYFALLASVLLFAVVRYRKYIWAYSTSRKYLIIGFVAYGIAVGSSWLGSAFREETEFADLYTVIGEPILSAVYSLSEQSHQLLMEVAAQRAADEIRPLGFYFMDRVYEESIEILGAAALLTAALAFFVEYRSQDGEL